MSPDLVSLRQSDHPPMSGVGLRFLESLPPWMCVFCCCWVDLQCNALPAELFRLPSPRWGDGVVMQWWSGGTSSVCTSPLFTQGPRLLLSAGLTLGPDFSGWAPHRCPIISVQLMFVNERTSERVTGSPGGAGPPRPGPGPPPCCALSTVFCFLAEFRKVLQLHCLCSRRIPSSVSITASFSPWRSWAS